MIDKEKVIKGLECCCSPTTYDCKNRCPYTSLYEPGSGYKNCMAALLPDALSLLKEKEPQSVIFDRQCEVEPGHWERKGFCPKCHQVVLWIVNREYCGFCGQKVKWNE